MSVRMRHPNLPEDQIIEVEPSAVPHWEYVGWKVIEGQTEQGEVWPAEAQRFEGQEQVRMDHPTLPGQQITIARSAVPMHRERGWVEVDAPQAPAAAAVGPESDAEASPDTTSTPRRAEAVQEPPGHQPEQGR